MTTARYDRTAAAAILARLAGPELFGPALFGPASAAAGAPGRVAYRPHRVTPEPGGRLTLSQRLYLERFMRPCTAAQVGVATHRLTWTDSDGVPCTGHYVEGGLGPIVPIAVRETTLALWRALAADAGLTGRIAGLTADERAVLAGTTTDREPLEIFRIGVEATGRALAQHALLAAQTPHREPAGFARAMAAGGVFAAVAGQWYWELQASTYRRGMVPARLTAAGDGSVRYPAETVELLRRMKEATIADAHAVMARATGDEGLSVAAAVHRYHDELDLISRQYALLDPGARPRCLALPAVLPGVVDAYVGAFAAIVPALEIDEQELDEDDPGGEDAVLYVPDMNCRHCQTTIRGVLESLGVPVHEVDLVTKRVVAQFRSPRSRARAAAAIRDSGYTVLGAP